MPGYNGKSGTYLRTKHNLISSWDVKETTRADFALELLMFVTSEKEGQMFIIFFFSPFFASCCPRGFKQG